MSTEHAGNAIAADGRRARTAGLGWVENAAPFAIIVTVAILGNLLIIAAPGYFSHDEWDRWGAVLDHGLPRMIEAFGSLKSGAHFGEPVRPIGLVQQLLSSLLMERWPVLVHLIDVLMHATIATLLYAFIRAFTIRRAMPVIAALVFAVSPATTLATGWSAASMDRWYVLFALIALIAGHRILRHGSTVSRCLGVLIGATGAILSKETALVLPIVMVGLIAFDATRLQSESAGPARQRTPSKRTILILIGLATAPIIAFLVLRAPAIIATLNHDAVTAYRPSPDYLRRNLQIYFAYPFVFGATEASVLLHMPKWIIGAGLAGQGLIIAGLAWVGGWRAPATYLAAYILPLAPVLLLPSSGSHYLYGSAAALSVAIAVLLVATFSRRRVAAAGLALVGLAVMIGHHFSNQAGIYQVAACQTRMLTGLSTLVLGAPGAKSIALSYDARAPSWILARLIHDRRRVADRSGLKLSMVAGSVPPGTADIVANMRLDCHIVRTMS